MYIATITVEKQKEVEDSNANDPSYLAQLSSEIESEGYKVVSIRLDKAKIKYYID
jgi:hypothetical protein